jgi:4-amino-4-deoxy-L-arabinose transferase-like glycosyltransferase
LTSPNPALVTERAATRLPRVALLLLCAAYLLPGLFGRDPWKSADITAFGYMVSLAKGHGSWLMPTVGGLPGDGALLPYWLGAGFIELLGPWLGAPLAARIPFALLLGLVMMLTWYSTFHLARTEAAQPLAFAFGGEAKPIDYARAVADGALLALIATLGLLQLGHETTPELGQLAGAALFLYALAASPFRVLQSRAAVLASLPVMAASGAPSIAMALGVAGIILCTQSSYAAVRKQVVWVIGAMVLAVMAATVFGAWGWRLRYDRFGSLVALLRQLLWFLWPAWPLALWTLWRWRKHLLHRHISVPLAGVLIALAAFLAMGRSDRALMLALPSLAVLAAFILPTLQRSTAAALDWFSVFFFTICALFIWVMYVAMQTGWPAKPAANVAKLAIGFTPTFSWIALVLALLASAAWLWLVQWRTGRNRHPLWKSLVLPASGVALCWLLAMTLWLPVLDYGLSYRALVARASPHVPPGACVAAPGMNRGLIVAFEYFGGYAVDAVSDEQSSDCPVLLVTENRVDRPTVSVGWTLVAREVRPTDNDTIVAIYKRTRLADR